MQMNVIIQGKDDPPKLSNLPQPIADFTENEEISVCLIEGGMVSGEPSVIIISSDQNGSICLQTSFDKWLMATTAMIAAAESCWGWKRPEGFVSLMPLDNEVRRSLLESIKTELEEWDEGQTEDS